MVGEKLHAVADAENRNIKVKKFHIQRERAFIADTVRTAGKNQGAGLRGFDGFNGRGAGQNFRVDAGLTHATGDELGYL